MRLLRIVAAVHCLTTAGCITSEAESVDTTEQSLITSNKIAFNKIAFNKIAFNKIAFNKIALNKIAFNKIAFNKIAFNKIAFNKIAFNKIAFNKIAFNKIAFNKIAFNKIAFNGASGNLLDSEDGREVLKYVIECAIPEGITLVGTDSQDVEHEFDGSIGLAPGWLNHALTENDQRWVSACMFARVNAHDVSVEISMRGQSKALETSDEERAEWSAEEGGFYGQLFVPESEPIRWYACSGRDLDVAHNDMRDCANPDPNNPGYTVCGFTYTGDCRTTCESYSKKGEYYRNCASGEDDDGGDYHQVITTFVQP